MKKLIVMASMLLLPNIINCMDEKGEEQKSRVAALRKKFEPGPSSSTPTPTGKKRRLKNVVQPKSDVKPEPSHEKDPAEETLPISPREGSQVQRLREVFSPDEGPEYPSDSEAQNVVGRKLDRLRNERMAPQTSHIARIWDGTKYVTIKGWNGAQYATVKGWEGTKWAASASKKGVKYITPFLQNHVWPSIKENPIKTVGLLAAIWYLKSLRAETLEIAKTATKTVAPAIADTVVQVEKSMPTRSLARILFLLATKLTHASNWVEHYKK